MGLSEFEITSKQIQEELRGVGHDRGRPANTVFDRLHRTGERVDIESHKFFQHVDPTKAMPKESTELDFFLFIDNKVLSDILRET